ncbi:flagellar assembly protein FliW [candidate division KSB1 bacterium]|nr:flagellar assembly protein FliW [candidate division KSB1 bacterium]
MNDELHNRILPTPFGELSLDKRQVLTVPNGILGFEHFKKYLILDAEEYRPFKLMVAIDDPRITFIVVEPLIFFPDYTPNISKTDLKDLKIDNDNTTKIYSIVTLSRTPEEITVNLSGPIYVNTQTFVGKQIALTGDSYSTKHNLFKNEPKFFKEDVPC